MGVVGPNSVDSIASTPRQPSIIVQQNLILTKPMLLITTLFRFSQGVTLSYHPLRTLIPTPRSQLSNIDITSLDVYEVLVSPKPSAVAVHSETLCVNTCRPNSLFAVLQRQLQIFTKIMDKIHPIQIHPIFKKGNKSGIENYRPISLLQLYTLYKVLEKIILKKVMPFLQSKISKEQFGFRSNSSCLTQLLRRCMVLLKAGKPAM